VGGKCFACLLETGPEGWADNRECIEIPLPALKCPLSRLAWTG